eukprot:6238958-Karenia_brevis.AAC.1
MSISQSVLDMVLNPTGGSGSELATANTIPGPGGVFGYESTQTVENKALLDMVESMPPVIAGDAVDQVKKLVTWSIAKYGGPTQVLRMVLGEHAQKEHFAHWLDEQFPRVANMDYWSKESEITASKMYAGVPTDFAFDMNASAKPFCFAVTCLKLAEEYDKDGYITESEPLTCF